MRNDVGRDQDSRRLASKGCVSLKNFSYWTFSMAMVVQFPSSVSVFADPPPGDTPSLALVEAHARVRDLELENDRLRQELETLKKQVHQVTPVHDEAPKPEERSLFKKWDEAAAATRTEGHQWFTLMYQWDTREFNTLNVEGSAPLPLGFNVWGFVDFMTPMNDAHKNEDIADFFYEIDLKRKVVWDCGVILEANDQQGLENAVGRAGVFWEPKSKFLEDTHLWFLLKAFPYETDHEGGQVAIAWDKRFSDFLEGRFSMGGFFDVNINSGADDDGTNIVSETEFRLRLIEGLHFVTELRYNGLLDADDDFGIGFGLKYNF